MSKQSSIILAAGKGLSDLSISKVSCEILFKPMIKWTEEALTAANIKDICVVADSQSDSVNSVLDENVKVYIQNSQSDFYENLFLVKDFLYKNQGGDVLVIYGDRPLMGHAVIENAYITHQKYKNAVTVIATRLNDPSDYDRIVRSNNGVKRIVEQKCASESELLIKEVDAGAYWFNVDCLLNVIDILSCNDDKDIQISEMIDVFLKNEWKTGIYSSENEDIVLSADSNADLFYLNQVANRRIIEKFMENGVKFLSLDGILISNDVRIGKGTCILPGSILRSGAVIGENCVIGPNSLVEDTVIGNNTKFNASQCYRSKIGSGVTIGPFCHIRPNSCIKDGVHIGDFVEVKNSTVGDETHISHLTYVGDSDVGKHVNFGCGVVTVNYNGKSKNRCVIGDNAFIGCNTNLVAPVKIGNNGYTAAGSTITNDVPDESLAIARARQTNKEGYNKKLRE